MSEVEKSVWETLRTSRERLGLSINDVSVATKINPRILKALEAGEREGLPPKSFTRGFIRSYAAYLKIDAQPILDAYSPEDNAPKTNETEKTTGSATRPASADQDSAAETAAMNSPVSAGAKDSQTRKAFAGTNSTTASKAALIGGLLVLIGVVVGVKNVVDKYAQERVIEPAPVVTDLPASATDAATPATDEAAAPTAAAKDENAPVATEAPVTAAAPTPTTETAKVEPPKAEATPAEVAKTEPAKVEAVKPTPAPAPTPVKAETPIATPVKAEPLKTETPKVEAPKEIAKKEAAKPEAAKTETAKAATPQEVILEALDKVEVSIRIDGESSKKLTLSPESVHTIKAKSSIEIEVSDGGMVNVIHNGRERGVPGDLGKSAKLKYP